MTRHVDYDHLHNQIMDAVHLVGPSEGQQLSDEFGELIDFLETMYVNSVLSLVGALLAVAKHVDDPAVSVEGLKAARELLDAPRTQVQAKLTERYKAMLAQLNLPDAYQEKTHNEQVSAAIKEELGLPGT